MEIVRDRLEITDLVARFRNNLLSKLEQEIHESVGFHGGGIDAVIRQSANIGMWLAYSDAEDKQHDRYWTAFGLYKANNLDMSIVTEINFAAEGVNRRLGGAFFRSTDGATLVVHRGNIGGGRLGIGKSLFRNNFKGKSLVAFDGTRQGNFAVVGELDSADLVYQVKNFVAEVARIKSLV